MRMYTLDFAVGEITGTVTVNAEPDETEHQIIAKAWRRVTQRKGGAPMGLCADSFAIMGGVL